jgi:hypothetical protein
MTRGRLWEVECLRGLAVACATLTYVAIERPFLRLKGRVAA